jgi:hypothetical protein
MIESQRKIGQNSKNKTINQKSDHFARILQDLFAGDAVVTEVRNGMYDRGGDKP